MKKKFNHGIILPLKEIFTKNKSGAVSIFVHEYLKESKLNKETIVFTNKTNGKYLIKNTCPIKIKSKFFTNLNYIKSITKTKYFNELDNIEVHNRPSYAKYLIKKFPKKNITLVLHNIAFPRNSNIEINEKLFLIKNCKSLIFVSNFLKNEFFKNLDLESSNNSHVVYNSITIKEKFNNKKKKIIIFAGKLNKSKGYDIFGEAIIKILNEFKDWKSIVIGDERRETFKFSHKNLIIKDWIPHDKLLSYYDKASISIVNPVWQEPFGRTALESSSRGCAVVTTNSGGLSETFKNNLVLKENNPLQLYNLIKKLIKNPIYLKAIQKENFNNRKIFSKTESKKLDNIKIKKNIKDLKVNKKFNILHIGVFGSKLSFRTYDLSIASKISNGLIRCGHHVINYDYRSKNIIDNYLNLSSLNDNKIDKEIYLISKNYKPDLILLGHNNVLKRETIIKIKKEINSKFCLWYEDHITKGDPNAESNLKLIEKNNDLIDKYFITTHPKYINTKIKKNKIYFLPMTVDDSVEKYNLQNYPHKTKDLFFAISHGINRGSLKKNHYDARIEFINKLNKNNKLLKFNFLGFNKEEPKWNYELYDEMKKCYFALNLSRGGPYIHTSSNRISTYVGNGMPTCVDERLKFSDYFNSNEMIFYKNEFDLLNKLSKLLKNPKKIALIGNKGKEKYFKLFNNLIIADYILSKTFNYKSTYKFIWER